MSLVEVLSILRRDLPEPFVTCFHSALRGEYSKVYEDMVRPPGGFVVPRPSSDWDKVDLRAVRNARRGSGLRALMRACREYGAPFQVKALACNGQTIVIGQVGQLLILAEPIDNLSSRPERAAYKADLAASHFAIRQLEMDLGDGWRQRIDARNTLLVVVQHGMRIGGFNRRDTALEMMRLVVPDAAFGSWLVEANVLNGELSALLDWSGVEKVHAARPIQEDRVAVKLKRNVSVRDVEQ